MDKKNINNLANAKVKQNPSTNQLFDPNETTTPVLKARGATRVALGPGHSVRGLTPFKILDWAQ